MPTPLIPDTTLTRRRVTPDATGRFVADPDGLFQSQWLALQRIPDTRLREAEARYLRQERSSVARTLVEVSGLRRMLAPQSRPHVLWPDLTDTMPACRACDNPMVGRVDRLYCSNTCRQRAYRHRKQQNTPTEVAGVPRS